MTPIPVTIIAGLAACAFAFLHSLKKRRAYGLFNMEQATQLGGMRAVAIMATIVALRPTESWGTPQVVFLIAAIVVFIIGAKFVPRN